MRFSSLLAVSFVCTSTALGAQRPPANTDDLFTRVVGVRELRDGGVLVGDAGANALFVLSPDFRAIRPVEKRHASVTALFPATAGGATLFDLDGARLIGIDSVGRISRSDTVPPAAVGGRAHPLEILHMDTYERAYFTGERANPRTNAGRDSVPLLRRKLDQVAADTITWLRVPTAIIESPTQAGQPPVIRVPTALAWRDVWAVDPAGRVAVVRGDDYHVEWFDGARKVSTGPIVSASRLPLTDADRRAVARNTFNVTLNAPTSRPRIVPDTISLPAAKPFFVENGARVDHNGELWVERSRNAADRETTYDVIDATGKPRYTVVLANDARVVGFSDTALYASIRSANGKARLSRHQRPWR